jgi:hypothetical protein
MATIPIFAPDGTLGDVPADRVNDATLAGGKVGINLIAPDGSRGTVPHGKLGEALKAGARIESPVDASLATGQLKRDPRVPTQFETDRSGGKGTLASLISDIRGGLFPTAQNPYPGMGVEQKQQAAQQSAVEDQSRKDAGYGRAYRAVAPVAEAVGANVPGMEQSAARGDAGGVVGHAAAPIAAYVALRGGGEAISRGIDALPSTARAGANFQVAMNAAGDKSIDLSVPGNSALQVQDLANAGGQMPKVVRDFLRRVTDPEQGPLTYADARKFYSNASRLSSAEYQKLTPVMQKAVSQFTADLGHSIGSTAEAAGVGPQYQSAMKEYANASRMKRSVGTATDAIVKYLPYAAAGYTAKKIIEGK